jgi:phage shock protein E
MKKALGFITLLLLLALPLVITGCDYVTGKALDNNTTTTIPPHRWVWSNIDGTVHPSTVVDRNTGVPIRDVTPLEAFAIATSSSYLGNPVILDVRTPEEYAEGHIHNAVNINLNSPDFKDEINKLDKNRTYLVYCRSGARSNTARKIMEESGFKYVINMTGGMNEWISMDLPVDK